jgi:hypothetical protein
VLLAALAYVLIERMRALVPKSDEFTSTQIDTLRIRLLKLAGVVTCNRRRVRLYSASNWPNVPIFTHATKALYPAKKFIQRLARTMTPRMPASQTGEQAMALAEPP